MEKEKKKAELSISVHNKTAIVMGATGLIGNHLIKKLLQDDSYEKVLTIGRTESGYTHEKLRHIAVDFDKLSAQDKRIKGHDLYIAFGTTRAKAGSKERFREIDYTYPMKVIKSAYANGVRQVLLVSSIGADSDAYFFYLNVKGELEDALRQMDFWAIHIFRPSLLIGNRNESRLGEDIAQVIAKGLNYFTRRMVYKYKPINAVQLAGTMVRIAQNMESGVHIYESARIHNLADSYGLKLNERNT